MVGYRCYILDAQDHILQAHDVECVDDAQAQSAAQHLLAQDPYHQAVEVWERARRIVKLDRPPRRVMSSARAPAAPA